MARAGVCRPGKLCDRRTWGGCLIDTYMVFKTEPQAFAIERFAEMIVHACRLALKIVVLHRMRRQRVDGEALPAALAVADFTGGFVAVELRHLTIHQYQVVSAGLPGSHGPRAVLPGVDEEAAFLQ